MASLKLKIVVLDTHDVEVINVADASTYPDGFLVLNPTLVATAPGFPPVNLTPFNVGGNNMLTSDMLGITAADVVDPLPDGIYQFSYSITPSSTAFTNISIMRVDRLQEKFDHVFMSLDFMVCDNEIKTQAKVQLNTIYLLIQGSIAAANECAIIEANQLYDKASMMLDRMIAKNCGCTGNNFITNFP